MPSKRRSKSKNNKRGHYSHCNHCNVFTEWYVITGNNDTWCLDCMEKHGWEHLSATKEAITKDGGANGSQRTVPKRIANLSQDSWVVSLVETSKSKQKKDE